MRAYHEETAPLTGHRNNPASDLSIQALNKDETVKNRILEIVDIMERTMKNNVTEQDIDKVNQNIHFIRTFTRNYLSAYRFDVYNLTRNRNNIINEINNHLHTHMPN